MITDSPSARKKKKKKRLIFSIKNFPIKFPTSSSAMPSSFRQQNWLGFGWLTLIALIIHQFNSFPHSPQRSRRQTPRLSSSFPPPPLFFFPILNSLFPSSLKGFVSISLFLAFPTIAFRCNRRKCLSLQPSSRTLFPSILPHPDPIMTSFGRLIPSELAPLSSDPPTSSASMLSLRFLSTTPTVDPLLLLCPMLSRRRSSSRVLIW